MEKKDIKGMNPAVREILYNYVTPPGGGGGGGGGVAEGGAYDPVQNLLTLIGAIVNQNGDEPLTDGAVAALAIDAYRGLWLATADRIAKANRIVNIHPDHLVKMERLAVIDESATATATTRTILDFYGYDNATVGVICTGLCDVDIFGTNNPDADSTADTGWISLSATTITNTTDGWVINGQEPWDRIMIKHATTGAYTIVVDCVFGG